VLVEALLSAGWGIDAGRVLDAVTATMAGGGDDDGHVSFVVGADTAAVSVPRHPAGGTVEALADRVSAHACAHGTRWVLTFSRRHDRPHPAA